jgi:hypothetical protein
VAQHRAIRRLRSLAQTETTTNPVTNTVTNTVIGTGIETRSGGPPAAAGPA